MSWPQGHYKLGPYPLLDANATFLSLVRLEDFDGNGNKLFYDNHLKTSEVRKNVLEIVNNPLPFLEELSLFQE